MFVVNTTSATAGTIGESSRPRKRVPSSRRRNPGTERWSVNVARLWLLWLRRLWSWRRGSGSGGWRGRARLGCRLERYRRVCLLRHRWRSRGCRGRQRLVEDGGRDASASGRNLKHEREEQEHSAARPAGAGEEVSRLPGADQ